MSVFGLILFIIGVLGIVFSLGYSLYRVVPNIKTQIFKIDYLSLLKKLIPLGIAFSVSMCVMCVGIVPWAGLPLKAVEWVCVIVGGLFVGALGCSSLFSFLIHYYGKGIDEKLNKWLFVTLMVAFPLLFVMIFILSDGYADYLTYPLINGLSFSSGWVSPKTGGANIAFYALCILSGAIYVYFLCDHKLYMQYGKHGLVDSTFLVAFPAGIIGARIFYVVGNFNVPISQGGFGGIFDGRVFAIWEGGLTILGGAITGIVVGVAWFMWRKKGYNIWLVVDIIVPTILIAQAVGRWGNFFNCEVHGIEVSKEYWGWLPKVVLNNATYSSEHGFASAGNIFVPLFFIESLANMLGYFVLAHLFGNRLRKYTELGDLAFGYLIWYGLTRTLMEPLRDASFNMGTSGGSSGYWSWVWAMAFIAIGSLSIVCNHLIRYLLAKKKDMYVRNKNSLMIGSIATTAILAISIALIVVAVNLMKNNSFAPQISYNPFNTGIILLVIGVAILLGLVISIIHIVEGLKARKTTNA